MSSPYLPTGVLVGDGSMIANETTRTESEQWVLITDTVILSFTIIGALSIVGSMVVIELRGRTATTRTRIVQSLVMSDLVLGITGLIGSTMSLSPNGLHTGTVSCDALGVLLVAVLWTQHLWTSILAFATFMILCHPLNAWTMRLEKKWYYLWIFVWALSFGVSVIGYEIYGYVSSGGICYYPSGLYGELIQFIPRGCVFIFITILYARLYVFLRRPDRIRSPYSDTPDGSYQSRTGGHFSRRTRKISSFFKHHIRTEHQIKTQEKPAEIAPEGDSEPVDLQSPRSSIPLPMTIPSSPTGEIPPWERVELPVFEVDGQRYGGTSAPTQASLWGNWKGLGGKEQRKRPSTSPQGQYERQFGSTSSSNDQYGIPSPRTMASPRLQSIPSELDPLSVPNTMDAVPTIITRRRSSEFAGSIVSPHADRVRNSSAVSATIAEPLTPSASSTHLGINRHEQFDPHQRRTSAMTHESHASLIPPQPKQDSLTVPSPNYGFGRDPADVEGGAEGGDGEDGDWDLLRVLQQTAPTKTADDRLAVPREGETVELVQESMASYLNRKTALLMLWFPLGYVLLFSVSLIRLIYDFAGEPPASLRAISRWFIFAQGILDALIYGLVEWHTKRVVRRRVRKGTFSPGVSENGSFSALGSALRALGGRRSQTASNAARSNPVESRIGQTATFSQTRTTNGDPRSILQELQPGKRKKSSAASDETTAFND